MRTDSLIIFSVRRSSYVSKSRGKQSKHFIKNNVFCNRIFKANVNCLKLGGTLENLESGGTALLVLGEPMGARHVALPLKVE